MVKTWRFLAEGFSLRTTLGTLASSMIYNTTRREAQMSVMQPKARIT